MDTSFLARRNPQELLTRLECERLLANVLGAENTGKLLEFTINPELSTIGYLGEYFHLLLRYQHENESIGETRLFIKSMPFTNADMSYFIEKSGILKKEATLYEILLNKLSKYSKTFWCAQCFLAKKELFVMQNITDLGYEPVKEPAAFLAESQIKVLLQGLAALHASSIAYELEHKVNIGVQLQDVLFEATVHPTVDWYTAGLKAVLAVIAAHPKYQTEEMQKFISDQLPARLDEVYEMVNPSTKYRNVFCHRDPWGGNVFFHKTRPNEVPAVFVDFQLCRYSPAAIDVLMATYLNIKPTARRPLMISFCQHYHKHFTDELSSMGHDAETEMSLTAFQQSIAEMELFGALYNCISATILRVPDGYLKNMKKDQPEDFHHYVNIERTKQVLTLMDTNDKFRAYMYECTEDLMALVVPTLSTTPNKAENL